MEMDARSLTEQVITLGCHKMHLMHKECYEKYKVFAIEKRQELNCPYCRVPVDQKAIQKVKFFNPLLKQVDLDNEAVQEAGELLPFPGLEGQGPPLKIESDRQNADG